MSDRDAAAQPLLHCLDGQAAPLELGVGVRGIAAMNVDAEQFESLLLQLLEPLPDDQLDGRIGRLCRREDLPLDVAGPALKGARFVLRQAAAHDLDDAALGSDLTSLGCTTDVRERLVAIYEKARPDLRREIAMSAVLAHGKVLSGLEWRIDTIGSSNMGRGINVPVAMLTMHYQDGQAEDRITLQLMPEMVAGLRAICDQLLNR